MPRVFIPIHNLPTYEAICLPAVGWNRVVSFARNVLTVNGRVDSGVPCWTARCWGSLSELLSKTSFPHWGGYVMPSLCSTCQRALGDNVADSGQIILLDLLTKRSCRRLICCFKFWPTTLVSEFDLSWSAPTLIAAVDPTKLQLWGFLWNHVVIFFLGGSCGSHLGIIPESFFNLGSF